MGSSLSYTSPSYYNDDRNGHNMGVNWSEDIHTKFAHSFSSSERRVGGGGGGGMRRRQPSPQRRREHSADAVMRQRGERADDASASKGGNEAEAPGRASPHYPRGPLPIPAPPASPFGGTIYSSARFTNLFAGTRPMRPDSATSSSFAHVASARRRGSSRRRRGGRGGEEEARLADSGVGQQPTAVASDGGDAHPSQPQTRIPSAVASAHTEEAEEDGEEESYAGSSFEEGSDNSGAPEKEGDDAPRSVE